MYGWLITDPALNKAVDDIIRHPDGHINRTLCLCNLTTKLGFFPYMNWCKVYGEFKFFYPSGPAFVLAVARVIEAFCVAMSYCVTNFGMDESLKKNVTKYEPQECELDRVGTALFVITGHTLYSDEKPYLHAGAPDNARPFRWFEVMLPTAEIPPAPDLVPDFILQLKEIIKIQPPADSGNESEKNAESVSNN